MRMLNFIFFALFANVVCASLDGNSSDTTTNISSSSGGSQRSAAAALKREIAYVNYQDQLAGMPEYLIEKAIDQFIVLGRAGINPEVFSNAMKELADLQLLCTQNRDNHSDNPKKDSANHRKFMLIKALGDLFIAISKGQVRSPFALSNIYVQLESDIENGLVPTFFSARAAELIKATIRNKERFPGLQSEYISMEKQAERLFVHTSIGDTLSRKRLPPIESDMRTRSNELPPIDATSAASRNPQILKRLLGFGVQQRPCVGFHRLGSQVPPRQERRGRVLIV